MCTKWPTPSMGANTAPGGRYGVTSSGCVPHPMNSGSSPSTPRNGTPMPGTRCIDHSGRHGPEPAGTHDRIDLPPPAVRVVAGPDRHEVPQPVVLQPGVHPAPPPGQLVEGAGLALPVGRPAAVVEPAGDLGLHHPRALAVGDVRPAVVGRQPVQVDQPRHPVRAGVGQLEQDARTLRVTEEHDRLGADRIDHRQRVAHVGLPAVEQRPVGVAAAAGVPGHAPVAGLGEHRREHVERAREVEAAVRHHDGGRIGIAPLVDGETDTVRRHGAPAVRTSRAGVRDHLVGRRHQRDPTDPCPRGRRRVGPVSVAHHDRDPWLDRRRLRGRA